MLAVKRNIFIILQKKKIKSKKIYQSKKSKSKYHLTHQLILKTKENNKLKS